MSAASEQAAPVPKQTSSAYMILVMTAVATLCGLLIVTVFQLASPAIARNRAKVIRDSVNEVLSTATTQKIFAIDLANGTITENPDEKSTLPKIYVGYDDSGKLAGIAIEASGRGYQDIINVLYSYSPDKACINGFKVLESKETPGLGAKIASDPGFLDNFNDLDVALDPTTDKPAHEIVTVKHGTKSEPWQIDAISGATISSKAVGNIIRVSTDAMLPIVTEHLDEIRKAGTQ